MTTKKWILVLGILVTVCCLLLIIPHFHGQGTVVTISQDGSMLYTIDISRVAEPYELTVTYGDHYNIISVSSDQIYVLEADCANQVCVDHGPLQQSGAPITCLPHHLVIQWARSGVDAG